MSNPKDIHYQINSNCFLLPTSFFKVIYIFSCLKNEPQAAVLFANLLPSILHPGEAYALNRQLVAKVEPGGTYGAVQHGFELVGTSRAADNSKLFKIRFKSIIKSPV